VAQKAKGALIVFATAALVMTAVLRGCETVVARWPLSGDVPTVHPAIRAWDAGVRE